MTTQQPLDADTIGRETAHFMIDLMKESERAAVIIGASRLEVALENLLRANLKNPPTSNSKPFEFNGPLGTFSSRIMMAYHLGIISREVRIALTQIRQLRNDYAHNYHHISLSDQNYSQKIQSLTSIVDKDAMATLYTKAATHFAASGELFEYGKAIVVLTNCLEVATLVASPLESKHVAEFK